MSEPARWTRPEDVAAQVGRRWEDGRILSAALTGEPLFPLRIALRSPRPAELGERFEEVKRWVHELDEGSKARRGFGYELGWTEAVNRVVGRNRVPSSVSIPTEADGLRLIGRVRQAERFRALAAATVAAFPALGPWLARRPMALLEHAGDWERVLAVLRWFGDHPRPGLYLRQLDVPGVDTKFIESHRGLLAQLLDATLAPPAVDGAFTGAAGFEARYGLRSKPALVRFRALDPALRVGGFSDLTVPVSELREGPLPATRVFVTENEVNGLAFPEVPGGVVLFGLGYGLDRLSALPWLREKRLYYWGDVDTHGFAILSKLRASFPQTISLLMDRETLAAHRALWVREEDPYDGELPGLTDPERALFEDLRRDRLGDRVRLEQERIGFGWLQRALDALGA